MSLRSFPSLDRICWLKSSMDARGVIVDDFLIIREVTCLRDWVAVLALPSLTKGAAGGSSNEASENLSISTSNQMSGVNGRAGAWGWENVLEELSSW